MYSTSIQRKIYCPSPLSSTAPQRGVIQGPQFLCNGGQHYVPYRWLLISNKLCDSTLCTCGGVGGEEQVHNVIMTLLKLWGGAPREQRKSKREREDVYTTRFHMALTLAV